VPSSQSAGNEFARGRECKVADARFSAFPRTRKRRQRDAAAFVVPL